MLRILSFSGFRASQAWNVRDPATAGLTTTSAPAAVRAARLSLNQGLQECLHHLPELFSTARTLGLGSRDADDGRRQQPVGGAYLQIRNKSRVGAALSEPSVTKG